MKRRVKGDVVISQRVTILKLLTRSEDQTLLVLRDASPGLNLGFDVVDEVRRLNIESDGLTFEGLHEYLVAATQARLRLNGRLRRALINLKLI